MADVTVVTQSKAPMSVLRGKDATESHIGVTEYQFSTDLCNTDVTNVGQYGWFDFGTVMGESNNSPTMGLFQEKGGIPEVTLGNELTEESMQFAVSFKNMTNKGKQFALGSNDPPVVTNVSPAVATTVDSGGGVYTKKELYVADASGYSAGDHLSFLTGNATYGTQLETTRIKCKVGNKLKLIPPLSQLPENGSAVNQISKVDYTGGGGLPAPFRLRRLDHSNSDGSITITNFIESAQIVGTEGLKKGDGKVARNCTLTFEISPEQRTVNGVEKFIFTDVSEIYTT